MRCCSTPLGSSQTGIDLIAPNQENLVRAINVLEPTTNLLMKYNPEYTCLLVGAKWWLDNGGVRRDRRQRQEHHPGCRPESGRRPVPVSRTTCPIVAAKGGPGGKPGCGSLPRADQNFPVRQLVTNTGWGTGMDIRPNPGIGHPFWANYFPVTRAVPEPPSIRTRGTAGDPARCPIRVPHRTGRRSTDPTAHRCTPRSTGRTPATGPRTGTVTVSASSKECSHEEITWAARSLRLAIFVVVCLLGTFALVDGVRAVAISSRRRTYSAEFTNVSGLEEGNFVRIAGVEVGKVAHIAIKADNVAVVEFSADDTVVLTEGTKALIRYDNLIGGRYLGSRKGRVRSTGSTRARPFPSTGPQPALDLDALIGGFRPLFRALDPIRSTR